MNAETISLFKAFAPLIAVIGAVGIAIFQQKRTDGRVEEDRRRQLIATRAALPLNLSAIDTYVAASLKLFTKFHAGDSVHMLVSHSTIAPSVPSESIEAISQCILYADTKMVSNLTYLIKKIQIQHSRMLGILGKPSFAEDFANVHPNEINEILYGLLFMQELVGRFYRFARHEADAVDVVVRRPDMERAATFNLLDGPHFEGLASMISRRPFADEPTSNPALFFHRVT